jgi:hypothetical protein
MTTRLTTILTSALALALVVPAGALASPDNSLRRADGPLLRERDLATGAAKAFSSRRPTATPSAAGARGFGGLTAQEEAIAVNATSRRVTLFALDWSADCSDETGIYVTTHMPRMPLRRGAFSRRRVDRQDDGFGTYTFVNSARGRVTRGGARGAFRTTFVERDGAGDVIRRCDSRPVRFSLPRAYAGEMEYGDPFVLTTADAGRRVTGMHGSWASDCADPSTWFLFEAPPALDGGEVAADGAFRGTASQTWDEPPFSLDVSHDVNGTLTPRRADGVWNGHAAVAEIASGAQIDECGGAMGFSAVR